MSVWILGIAIVLGLLAVVADLSSRGEKPQGGAGSRLSALSTCADEIDTAVMKKLMAEPAFARLGAGGFGAWLKRVTSEQVDAAQSRLNEIREWNKANTDRCVRQAYVNWLDFFQRQINENRDELMTHAEQRDFEAYQKREADKRRKQDDFESTVEIPEPPKQ